MEHHHILCFLFVRGLTTILLLGALGVQRQQNVFRQVPTFLHVTSLSVNGPKWNPQTPAELERNILDI
jgi:hypothetical protein